MYVPQVRRVRQHPDSRQPLHSASQHRQREDVHLHLVLVHHLGGGAVAASYIPVRTSGAI